MGTDRKPMVINGEIISAPLPSAAQKVMADWITSQDQSGLAAQLEPLGLVPNDIVMPTFRRVVWLTK